jgi:CubicO group peptidase (beta-lactamase class C family)
VRTAASVAVAAWLGAATNSAAQTTSNGSDPLEVLASEMHARGAPGAAIAVVVGDSIVLARGLGVRSVEDSIPVSATTMFRVGSVTKMITGITAALLAHEGRLDLDAPIARAMPRLATPLNTRTMRQLLEHRAGLWNEAAGDGRHDDGALAARVDGWGAERLFASAGDVYSYSSPGYWLAGRVIERAADASYADIVERTLLAPVGMAHSAFRPTTALTYPLALDHVRDSGRVRVLRPFPDDASTWPSGSLFTSVHDLARLAIALMNDGRVAGRQSLPTEIPAMLLAPGSSTGGACSYAFGLQRCRRGDVHTVGHYGFRRGSGAIFTFVPEKKVAVIILAVGPGAILSRTEAAVLARYAGIGPASQTASTAVGPLASETLGTYVAGADTLTLSARGDSTFFRYRSEPTIPAWRANDGAVLVGDRTSPAQRFTILRGDVTGDRFLHDGLGAYRKIAR